MGKKVTLIVDSGATKASWAVVDGDEVTRVRTAGINAAVMPVKEVLAAVTSAAEQLEEQGANIETVEEIRFYGAGLVSSESILTVNMALRNVFTNATVACGTDLLAAAKAAFDTGEGIVAILGTGSNSGLYNGHKIVRNVRPGGFILGDEGSGCALGKAFVADWVKGLLPEDVREKFEAEFSPTYGGIVDNIYKGATPSAFLASIAPFVLSLDGNPYIDGLIEANLRNFIERSLSQYDLSQYEVSFVGSFAQACRKYLEALATQYGMRIREFIADPTEGLVRNLRHEWAEEEKSKAPNSDS
ncbi:MAG: ATPase [Bacteroidales bacterium]|nr:ATPase [Bacteroidales bacterium]